MFGEDVFSSQGERRELSIEPKILTYHQVRYEHIV